MAAAIVTVNMPFPGPILGQIVMFRGSYFMVRSVKRVERALQAELISVTCDEARRLAGDLGFVPSVDRYPEAG